MRCLVVGAGLCGAVAARLMAEKGFTVEVIEKRNHIGGNLYDEKDEHGCLIHRYGPHAFHTNDEEVYSYICRYAKWELYELKCGAMLDEVYSPSPFNFSTIDRLYEKETAKILKNKLQAAYPGQATVPVTELITNPDEDIRGFAGLLFAKDYAPYTAKQWGVPTEEIDPSVLKRVPVRLSYKDGYFDDKYQVIPSESYTGFIENLLDHPDITVQTGVDGLDRIKICDCRLFVDGEPSDYPVIYTGAADELFGCCYGNLPYRSLRFEFGWKDVESLQDAAIVAYPKAEGYTRITEYTKLPYQKISGTSYAVEYPMKYEAHRPGCMDEDHVAEAGKDAIPVVTANLSGTAKKQGLTKPPMGSEPYYPVLTPTSIKTAEKYFELAGKIDNLFLCGRLANFKYYNMDQAVRRAMDVCEKIIKL